MKYNELNNYKVRCRFLADEGDIIDRSSESGYDLLSDYNEEIKTLFESHEEVDIKTIEDYLKSEFSNIISIEPLD